MKCFSKRILFLIVSGILLFCSEIDAQTSAYHSIVFPYEPINVYTISELNNSIPDAITSVQLNPGSLALLTRASATALYNIKNTSYNFNYDYGFDPENRWELENSPGLLTLVFPFTYSNQNFVLGFSGQYIPAPGFDFPDGMQWDEMTRIAHKRSGNVWNANLALGTYIQKNFGIGINVSRWFGNWKWEDYVNAENFGSGTFNYSGTNLSLGAVYQFSRFNIGLTLYSPFTLMTGDNIEIQSWFINTQIRNIEQKFDGAGRLGVSYNLTPATQIGFGYRFQAKTHIKNYYPEDTLEPFENTYSSSHQFSSILNHEFQWKSLKLPVFIGYQLTYMPETENLVLRDYQQINVPDKDSPQHAVSAGINAVFHSVGFYIAGRWDHGKIQVKNNSTPPWS